MTPVLNTCDKGSLGTVLLVDDDQEALTSYAWMLRSEGYTVVTADNAEDGLRQAEHHQPDAILLDLRMPLMDGLEFLRHLRARKAQRATPVAIVTGDYFIDESIAADLQTLGAGLLLKPLWFEDLIALVQRLLALRADAPLRR